MKRLLLGVVILSLLLFTVKAINICGGTRPLPVDVLGDFCDCGTESGCAFGTTVCGADLNTLMCMPNCSITVKMILESSKKPDQGIMIPTCENNGMWDFAQQMCLCPIPFIGDRCETRDTCYGIDCNKHGVCRDGTCVCDSSFTGAQCEIHKDCRSFNVVWTGTRCECAKGWAGSQCDICSNTSICIPNKDLRGYTLYNVYNEYLYKSLLAAPTLPGWGDVIPYKPTPTRYQCQCMPSNYVPPTSSLIEGIVDVSHIHRVNREERHVRDDDTAADPYIEDFFEHHHHHRSYEDDGDDDWDSIAAAIYCILIIVIIFAILMCCFQPYYAISFQPEDEDPENAINTRKHKKKKHGHNHK